MLTCVTKWSAVGRLSSAITQTMTIAKMATSSTRAFLSDKAHLCVLFLVLSLREVFKFGQLFLAAKGLELAISKTLADDIAVCVFNSPCVNNAADLLQNNISPFAESPSYLYISFIATNCQQTPDTSTLYNTSRTALNHVNCGKAGRKAWANGQLTIHSLNTCLLYATLASSRVARLYLTTRD